MPLVKVIAGFFRLIRLPNLIFIALTQLLLQYCIYEPLYRPFLTFDDTRQFVFLVFASIFIAAAGYIINDYFDVDIDQINKPSRLVIGKLISKRGSIFLHFIFNAAGLVFTFLATRSIQQSYLVFLNLGVIFLLWFYSVRFKKTLLIGNIIISFLVAWVIVIFFLSKMDPMQLIRGADKSQSIFYQLTILYAGFAFLSTFIRELIKDVEDQDGDRRHGCKTCSPMLCQKLVAQFSPQCSTQKARLSASFRFRASVTKSSSCSGHKPLRFIIHAGSWLTCLPIRRFALRLWLCRWSV